MDRSSLYGRVFGPPTDEQRQLLGASSDATTSRNNSRFDNGTLSYDLMSVTPELSLDGQQLNEQLDEMNRHMDQMNQGSGLVGEDTGGVLHNGAAGQQATTQRPLWSLYSRQLVGVDPGSGSVGQFPLQDTDSSDDQFLAFAGETQQQRRSLLLHQQGMHPSGGHQTHGLNSGTGADRRGRGGTHQQASASSSHMGAVGRNGLSHLREVEGLRSQAAPRYDGGPGASAGAGSARQSHRRFGYDSGPPSTMIRARSQSREHATGSHVHSPDLMFRTSVESGPGETDSPGEPTDPVVVRRAKFKAKSSIPPDLSSSNYAQQCAAAAVSCRLQPYRLNTGEYNILRPHLSYLHVTTYLNIRNGILRLWMSNPLVNVTLGEAAGCARDERFFGLAEFAYEWLVRNGYINYGCVEYPPQAHDFDMDDLGSIRKPRPTIVIIGGGIAGLGCARQLTSLLKRYANLFTEYEDLPRILILEGRRRIGGRIYSAPLKSAHDCQVDLGADVIMGFGRGNPLGVIVRRQLGLPIIGIDPPLDRYDVGQAKAKEAKGSRLTASNVGDEVITRSQKLFRHILDKMAQFKNVMRRPITAEGDQVLMRAAKDPVPTRDEFQEYQTIAKMEESGEMHRPYEDPGSIADTVGSETNDEMNFLQSIGVEPKLKQEEPSIHVVPEPAGDLYPSLGETISGMVDQLADVSKLTPQDVRMLNWHIANLEHSHGCNLDELSLGSWNQAEGYEFSGRHCMVRDGYSSLCRGLYIYPDKLDVRFKTTVKVIEYDEESAAVFLENGERIDAARVVVTVPLGVLKDRTIQFIPDLPQWKTDSIERLGFGVVNKVCLVFEDVFWDESQDVICISQDGDGNDEMHMSSYQNTRGRFFMFLNCTKSTRRPCLVGMVAGNAAIHLVNESDDELVEQARCVLEKVYPKCRSVELTESIVTRWQIDPFSRGSFSYVGLEASGADFDLVGRQIGSSLHFAGEATNRMYPGTVHGAYISGLRAAKDVLTSFVGEIEVPSPLIPFRDHHALRNPYPTYPSSQVSSARPTPKLPGSHYPMDTAQIRASLLSEPSLRRSTDAAIYSDSDRPGVSQTKRKALLVDSEVTQDVNMQDLRDVEARYRELRDAREALDNERLRHDLLRELGPRPVKPERSGANPFLIYQKDFWDICKRETDLAKQRETGDPNVKASRNEVRAALGKRWRELPDNEKQPYIEETDNIKRTNNKKSEEFRRQIKQYDSEAEMFRRRWKEEHSTPPSDEEQRLAQIVAEGHEHDRRMFAKRNRMR